MTATVDEKTEVKAGAIPTFTVTLRIERYNPEFDSAPHFEDYPTRDDVNFMRHTMAYRNEDGSVRLDYKPVVETRYKPMERKY